MKNFIIALLLVGLVFAESKPRLTFSGAENIHDSGAEMYARYLHDGETGQEIVCITAFTHGDGAMACYPTGRTWK